MSGKRGASWTALAKRSGDSAFGLVNGLRIYEKLRACESGVALRLPPQSKTLARKSGRTSKAMTAVQPSLLSAM
jgi:hypothetical protein